MTAAQFLSAFDVTLLVAESPSQLSMMHCYKDYSYSAERPADTYTRGRIGWPSSLLVKTYIERFYNVTRATVPDFTVI
jgi:hypothetical protein